MFGHLGFSYVGLVFLLMLMIPNLIWTKNQPQGYSFCIRSDPGSKNPATDPRKSPPSRIR